jgi:hypothetical protein
MEPIVELLNEMGGVKRDVQDFQKVINKKSPSGNDEALVMYKALMVATNMHSMLADMFALRNDGRWEAYHRQTAQKLRSEALKFQQ